jgi:hypothetical protein
MIYKERESEGKQVPTIAVHDEASPTPLSLPDTVSVGHS